MSAIRPTLFALPLVVFAAAINACGADEQINNPNTPAGGSVAGLSGSSNGGGGAGATGATQSSVGGSSHSGQAGSSGIGGSSQAGQSGSSQQGGAAGSAGQGGTSLGGSMNTAGTNSAGSSGQAGQAGQQGGQAGQGGHAGQGGEGGSGSSGNGPSFTPPAATEDTYGCALDAVEPGVRKLYVDSSSSSGDGSRLSPLQSIQTAFSMIGDNEHGIICIAEGQYDEFVGDSVDSFSDNRRYTLAGGYQSGSGYSVRDSQAFASRIVAPNRSAATITFGNVRSWVIDGLDISNGNHGVLVTGGYSTGRHAQLLHSRIHDNGIDGEPSHSGAGISISAGEIIIEHNIVEDNTGGRLGGGIFVGGVDGNEKNTKDTANQTLTVTSALCRISGNLVRNNTLRHDTPHGVGIAVSMNSWIEGNVVVGNAGYPPANGPGGEAVGGGIFVQNPYVTATIIHNWVQGNRAMHAGAGIFTDEASVATIVGNVVVDNESEPGAGAICVDGRAGGDGPEDRGYATIVNNTVVGNSGGGLMVQDSTVVVVNNIFFDNGSVDLYMSAGGDQPEFITALHNRCSAQLSPTGTAGSLFDIGPGQTEDVPGFVNAAEHDFHLLDASPLRDNGVAEFSPAFPFEGALNHAPLSDYDGAPRPAGGGFSLGAFER